MTWKIILVLKRLVILPVSGNKIFETSDFADLSLKQRLRAVFSHSAFTEKTLRNKKQTISCFLPK